MTTAEFKKIARLLKQVYQELELEAIREGISTLSPEYDQLVAKAREKVLESQGFTLQEYREAKGKVSGFSQADYVDSVEQHSSKLNELDNRHIPTLEEIAEIAEEVAQKYIVPPQVTNQIVKEYTVEKPRIIETTKQTIIKEKYNAKPIEEKLSKLESKVNSIEIPEMNLEKFREELVNTFQDQLENNINVLDMPNFRKLAMGLRADIDRIDNESSSGGGTWGSITGTLSDQTDLQTALDAKLDGNGTATYIPFYSDANTLTSDAHFTYDSVNDVLHTHKIAGDATDGLIIESANGTDVGILGAANTANVTWYGSHNFDTVTASRVAQFGVSKTLESSTVTTTELGYLSGVTSAVQTQLGTKASTALSNLTSVAINTSLISDTNNTDDLGSSGTTWRGGYFGTLVRAPMVYGGDMSSTYVGYTGAVMGGTATHAVLDFVDNNSRIGEFYTTSSAFNFFTDAGKTLNFYVNNDLGNAALAIDTSRNITLLGNVLLGTDNTYDIGASGATRPRTLYLGTDANIGRYINTSVVTTGFGGSSAGSMWRDSVYGLTFRGSSGSSYEFAIFTSGGSGIFYGTTTQLFTALDLSVEPTKKLFLDGGSNTYLIESSADTVKLFTGGSERMQISSTGLAIGSHDLTMTGSLAATGARVTKGWFTDGEFTNVPTVGGSVLVDDTAYGAGWNGVTNRAPSMNAVYDKIQTLASPTCLTWIAPSAINGTDAFTTPTVTTNTTARVGQVSFPYGITANKISIKTGGTVGASGTHIISLFSEDGQTRVFSVTTATIDTAATIYTTALSAVVINPGIYYLVIQPVSTASAQIFSWQVATNPFATSVGLPYDVSSEPVMQGVYTVTADTAPATLTLASITETTNCTIIARFDN